MTDHTPAPTDKPGLDAEQIAEWRRLADAAIEGPWEFRPRRGFQMLSDNPATIGFVDEDRYFVMLREGAWVTEADMSFIAAARTAVPALVAEVERLRREMDNIGCSRFTCADDLSRATRRAEAAVAARDAAVAERDALRERVTAWVTGGKPSLVTGTPRDAQFWRSGFGTAQDEVEQILADTEPAEGGGER